jgi:hypothetical protein
MASIVLIAYIDAGLVGFTPKSPLLSPVSVMYAYFPSGENVIPGIYVMSILTLMHMWSLFANLPFGAAKPSATTVKAPVSGSRR